jgi:hypothetical protein
VVIISGTIYPQRWNGANENPFAAKGEATCPAGEKSRWTFISNPLNSLTVYEK